MSPATILIADDDRSIRTVLDQALGRAGHNVQATDNGSTLWQWVEAGKGDLVITDVVMPDVDGLDLVPRIKRLRPDLKIIVMSAQSTLLTAIKAVERGATVESVDRDIRTIFRQSGHDKQVEMRTFLLSDDPDRYEWAQ